MVTVKSSKPVKTKTVVCTKCAYALEYTGEDVQSKTLCHFDDIETYYFIVCPRESCGEKVEVSAWKSR